MKRRIAIIAAAAAIALLPLTALAQAGSATTAYETLGKELQDLNQQANRAQTLEAKMGLVDEIERKLVEFRKQYPNTPEAADAAFQLGILKHSVGTMTQESDNFNDAVRYLSQFIVSGETARDKLAFAHFYMAESYGSVGLYDDAESEYKLILADFGGINPRLTQFAEMKLAELSTARRLSVGAEPISFSVRSIDGESLSPEKYRGKVLLLDFWATWCGPCKAEMPNVKKVYDKYNSKGFEIVGISLDRSRDALDNYVAQNKIEWPQYFDGKYWNNDVATQYGVKSIPATYLIDKKGKIRYKSLRGRSLEKAVAELLAEEM